MKKILNAVMRYLILPILITISFFNFLLLFIVFFIKYSGVTILLKMAAYLCVLMLSLYYFIRMGDKDRIEVRREFKKIIGIFITFIGVLISGFGLWMLGLTVYSDIIMATQKGVVYQPAIIRYITIVGIGFIPLLVGIVIIRRASN